MHQRLIYYSRPFLILGLMTPEILLNPAAAHEVKEEAPYELSSRGARKT